MSERIGNLIFLGLGIMIGSVFGAKLRSSVLSEPAMVRQWINESHDENVAAEKLEQYRKSYGILEKLAYGQFLDGHYETVQVAQSTEGWHGDLHDVLIDGRPTLHAKYRHDCILILEQHYVMDKP